MARDSLHTDGMDWCMQNAETLIRYHFDGRLFLAIHPTHGVIYSAEDEDTLEAKLNDMRPSVRKQIYTTCTSLWIQAGVA